MIKMKKNIIESPQQPLSRIIREGTIGDCPICKSTSERRPWLFGKWYCINNKCHHYHNPIIKK